MSSFVLIDANSVGYAGQHGADLKVGEQPTQAIYNSILALRAQQALDPAARIFYLWDSKADFRFALHPEYKGKRNTTAEQVKAKDEYHSQQPFIERLVKSLGVTQIRIPGFEADDVAFQMTAKLIDKGHKVKLVSSDKDWLQMISHDVVWYDPRLDRTCNRAQFKDFTGFANVEQFVAAKCIEGDASDNIDGVPGLGEKACQLIFSRWPTINAMAAEYRSLPGGFTKELLGPEFGRCLKKLNAFCANEGDAMKTYIRNQKLINLSLAPKLGSIPLIQGEADEGAFFDVCGELAFRSITSKPQAWQSLFFEKETA